MDLFTALADREPADLSPDEREALEYFYAAVNIAEGGDPDSPARRWCAMAQNVGRIAHILGRMPRPGDPEAVEILQWVNEQRAASLNVYQRSWFASIPGGRDMIPD